MLFTQVSLRGAILIHSEKRQDDRGFFARTMCREEFTQQGLVSDFVQANHSFNRFKGTLRGMHFQRAPHSEVKVVRCVRGAIYDVIVDLRPRSPTYRKWEGFELTAQNGNGLYVPTEFAHGYITLVDETDVIYQVSHPYVPQAEGGLRYNDPAIGIKWPLTTTLVSAKDAQWPLLTEVEDTSS